MSGYQILLFLLVIAIFYMFFKQLFSGSFPKRGVDFEAKTDNEQIGAITQYQKTFSSPAPRLSRVEQLLQIADESVAKGDYEEAKKALSSAVVIEKENIEILSKYGFVLNALKDYTNAKLVYTQIIELDDKNDSAYGALANILHKLKMSDEAIEAHKKSIELDSTYAPFYFNYANTLYDLERIYEALEMYKKAYKLDTKLTEAKEMIDKLEDKVSDVR